MKKAKTRTPRILAQLVTSTRRAHRAIRASETYIAKSNRRLAKHKLGNLAQLLAEMPEGPPINRAWDNLLPVGLEVIDHAQLTAVAYIPPDALEAQMPDVGLDSLEQLRGMMQKPEKPVSIDAMNDAGLAKVVVLAAALKALIDEGRD